MDANLDFGAALAAVKEGQRITRAGWNGKGMFVFQRPADAIPLVVIPVIKSLPASVKEAIVAAHSGETHYAGGGDIVVKFTAYLCLYSPDSVIVNGWVASQTDLLANDWMILEVPVV